MKKVLVLLSLFFALTLSAQEMPSVAGVTFGWSLESCKRVLDNKFNGGEPSYQPTPSKLTYYSVQFGGYYFDYAEFGFQSDGNRTYLSYVGFYLSFDVTDSISATRLRDNLYKTYSNKYDFAFSTTNNDGYNCYYFYLGNDPQKGRCISINTFKEKTNNGEMKMWTAVLYFFEIIKAEDEI